MSWWADLKEHYARWRAPRFPMVIVRWGNDRADEAAFPVPRMRDCGHLSTSYAYDPIREVSSCMVCYDAMMARK